MEDEDQTQIDAIEDEYVLSESASEREARRREVEVAFPIEDESI